MSKLYLIPTPIAEGRHNATSNEIVERVKNIKYFVVERLKTARRFLKAVDREIIIDDLHFFEIDHNYEETGLNQFLNCLLDGHDVGLMSEAGCPAVADPGHKAVAWCHKNNIEVVPMVGPSSIILALMASGFNGQNFTFHGYLPNKKPELSQRLKQLDSSIDKSNQTQIFIETPYRNGFMIETIVETLSPQRLLCVCADLDSDLAFIKCMPLHAWKKFDSTELHKKPAIFLLGS
jgi:16S rRNA (cytidine1402-2'-O)-methyltransferase